jgi:hypothetical protein
MVLVAPRRPVAPLPPPPTSSTLTRLEAVAHDGMTQVKAPVAVKVCTLDSTSTATWAGSDVFGVVA